MSFFCDNSLNMSNVYYIGKAFRFVLEKPGKETQLHGRWKRGRLHTEGIETNVWMPVTSQNNIFKVYSNNFSSPKTKIRIVFTEGNLLNTVPILPNN